MNALLDLLRTGGQWRLLLQEFSHGNSPRYDYELWRESGAWEPLGAALQPVARRSWAHQAAPSAGVLDSQTGKTTAAGGERGCDGGKRITGRTRCLAVDTQGRLLGALVGGADGSAQQGARELLARLLPQWPRLQQLWADQGDGGLEAGLQRE